MRSSRSSRKSAVKIKCVVRLAAALLRRDNVLLTTHDERIKYCAKSRSMTGLGGGGVSISNRRRNSKKIKPNNIFLLISCTRCFSRPS